MTVKSSHLFPSFRQMFVGLNFSQSLDIFLCSPVQNLYDSILIFLDIMDATDINWEPILEMLPTQEMKDYDERMKYKNIIHTVWEKNKLFSREMFDLFNVNDQKGLTIYEIENGINDMTQTGDLFDRLNMIWKCIKHISILLHFSEKAINDAFKSASKLKYEKTKDMEEKLDFKQMRLFIRILRMTYCFYQVRKIKSLTSPGDIYQQLLRIIINILLLL